MFKDCMKRYGKLLYTLKDLLNFISIVSASDGDESTVCVDKITTINNDRYTRGK